MEPKSIMFARFPFMRCDDPDVTDWLVETVVKCKLDPRVSKISKVVINDTPITMGRNRAVECAKAEKADFLVMIDNDMKPDGYLGSNVNRLDTDTSARPFWDSSWDFMLRRYEIGPCMVGAPYCGPPPHENVYVFRWATYQTDHPNADLRIEQFTREEAVVRAGFEEVSCLPTGLVIIDMRIFDNPLVVPPYFTYEYTDKFEHKKASTEDCVFTRDLNMANIPLYVNWDAWAGHWKRKCVGKPKPIFREQVHKKFVEAATKGLSRNQKLFFAQKDTLDAEPIGDPDSVYLGAKSSGSGGQRNDSWDGQDGGGVVELTPSGYATTQAIARGSSPIGVFSKRGISTSPVSAQFGVL